MSEFLPFIVIGITTGAVYGLAGVGLVLTYKTSGIFNFAYGAIAAMAAMLAVMQNTSTFTTLTVAPWVSRAVGESARPFKRRPKRPRWIAWTATTVSTTKIKRT